MRESRSKAIKDIPSTIRELESSERGNMDKRGFMRRLKTRPIFQLFCMVLLLTFIFLTFRRYLAAPSQRRGKLTKAKIYPSSLTQNFDVQSQFQNLDDEIYEDYDQFDYHTEPKYFSSTPAFWPDFHNPLNIVEPNPPPIAHYEVPVQVLQIKDELYNNPDLDYSQFFLNLERLVHLDLKGAPPKLSYFKKFFHLIKSFGATGILIEYEDMFPYEAELKGLAANNAYLKTDIIEILNEAKKNDLRIIPLIQTFGHMEFVLKYPEYVHLREIENNPQVISPAEEESYKLVFAMLKQLKDVHGSIEYIHLGCDEVFKLGSGKSANMMKKQNMTNDEVFLKHVSRIAEYARGLGVQAIIWDDMLRYINEETLKTSGIGKLVQPMVWCYVPQPMSVLPKDIWAKYGKNFEHIWAASAFKGATGSFRFMTNAFYHEQNHLNWIEIMKVFGGTNESLVNFKGIAMTGWQRYDHFAVLCELLPAAIPSLGASILVLANGGFNPKIHFKLSQKLGCDRIIPLKLPTVEAVHKNSFKLNRTENCTFPGSDIYYNMLKLWVLREKYGYSKGKLSGWVSDYNMKRQFSSPFHVKNLQEMLNTWISDLTELDKVLGPELNTMYDIQTVEEWSEVNIKQYRKEMENYMQKLQYLSKPSVWPRRPLLYTDKNQDQANNKNPTDNHIQDQNLQIPPKQTIADLNKKNYIIPDNSKKSILVQNKNDIQPSKRRTETKDKIEAKKVFKSPLEPVKQKQDIN